MKKKKNLVIRGIASGLIFVLAFSVLPGEVVRADDNNPTLSTAYERMYAMATISWKPEKNMSIEYVSGVDMNYVATKTYKGMPYTQTKQRRYDDFKKAINKDGKLTSAIGTDCSYAVVDAWAVAGKNIMSKVTTTLGMFDKLKAGNTIIAVGTYTHKSSSYDVTLKVTQANGLVTMTAAYKKLKIGNALLKRESNKGHVVMVKSVDNNGVYYTDQVGMGYKDNNTPATCSWNTLEFQSFSGLYSAGFVPVYPKP